MLGDDPDLTAIGAFDAVVAGRYQACGNQVVQSGVDHCRSDPQSCANDITSAAQGTLGNLQAAEQGILDLTGIPGTLQDLKTVADPNASAEDQGAALGDLANTVFINLLFMDGAGEAGEEVELGLGAVEEGGERVFDEGVILGGGGCGGLSFSADTPVATPDGEQAISSLKVGDQVQAYDPQTGKVSTQAVQHVWINHDTDLLDVTLQVNTGTTNQTTQTQTTSTPLAGQKSPNAVQNAQTKSAAGAESPTTAPQAETTQEETIHTTANHPWLTADRGWVVAGKLQVGEPVLRADGTTAVVADVQGVPGAATMYDLEVSQIHTFEVGLGQWVVHNSRGPCSSKILDANLGGTVGDGLQAHHIIPCECQYMDVVVKSGLDINGRVNGILLPSDQSVAIINAQLRHYTNHPGWTDFMTEVLEQEEARLPKPYTVEEAQAAVSWAIGRGRRMLDALGFFFPGEPVPRE